jgi:hypothetical protein
MKDLLAKPTLSVLLAAVACSAVLALRHIERTDRVAIEVEMAVSRGAFVELYVNNSTFSPLRLPVVASQRHKYTFTPVPTRLTTIRIDPSPEAQSRIALYAVRILGAHGVLREFGPAELRKWHSTNLSTEAESPSELVFSSTSDDPIFSSDVQLDFEGWSLL